MLVADEPSLGLAPLVIEQVMEILREIAATGCAVLLVEEKLHGIAHVAERVIALDLGKVAWTRAASEVNAAALAATYLGVDRELRSGGGGGRRGRLPPRCTAHERRNERMRSLRCGPAGWAGWPVRATMPDMEAR